MGLDQSGLAAAEGRTRSVARLAERLAKESGHDPRRDLRGGALGIARSRLPVGPRLSRGRARRRYPTRLTRFPLGR